MSGDKLDDPWAAQAVDSGPDGGPQFVLQLFVTGSTTQSMRALANIKAICEEYLAGQYALEVIDIYREPERARAAQIFAVPTLIKQRPAPLRRFIGDLSDRARVLHGLNLEPNAS